MRDDIFQRLGQALKAARRRRGLTQPALASRLGRTPSRISELETDLANGRLGRDRLTLLAEICDALDLVPILAPREQVQAIERLLAPDAPRHAPSSSESLFDDLFVDLSDEHQDELPD